MTEQGPKLTPAAQEALVHAIWGGLADAGIAYAERYPLAEAILDEMSALLSGAGGAQLRFAYDPERRVAASA